MKWIAVSQRVDIVPEYGERRDAVDQKWTEFLAACGFLPLLLPNHATTVSALLTDHPVAGVLLTGGNDLSAYGGSAPERDQAELELLTWARQHRIPVMGVCRGMQLIQHHFGVPLEPVSGHVQPRQDVWVNGIREQVNSYHKLGTRTTVPDLLVWAKTDDGVIKAIRHASEPIIGLMWHPERMAPFRSADLALCTSHFGET
jgi:putative glutamine amidotransferase